jgi:hypothetical protein
MAQLDRRNLCDNLNHRRAEVRVRHCPSCGGVVNEGLARRACSEDQHATARRQQSLFCVDCGTRLIASA